MPLSTAERVLQALLALVVIGSVLAIGTVHVPTLLIVAVLAFTAGLVAIGFHVDMTRRSMVFSPLGLGVALSLYTLLQTVPLPVAALRHLTFNGADIWTRAMMPFGESGPRWASISVDPGSSMVEVIKWLVYSCVFWASLVVCRRRGAVWGAGLVFVSGVVLALTTVIHGLVGATAVYGLYHPHSTIVSWHVGPLLNPNNLAGYLNLAIMCGVGLLLSRRETLPRWLVAIGVATLVAVEVTSASRGGFLALPIGLIALSLILRRRRNSHADSISLSGRQMALLVAATVTGGSLWAILGGTRGTWAELYDKNLLKVRMLVWARPMIADHFWFGTGRGAFASVFPAYRSYPGNVVFSYAENFPAQWITEWGLPVGILAMAGFAWFMRPSAIALRRSTLAAGVAVGIGVLLLQNLFDLALELPSVAIAVAVALGSLWGGAMRSKGRGAIETLDERAGWLRLVRFAGIAIAVGILVIAIGPAQALQDLETDKDDVYRDYTAWAREKTTGGRDNVKARLRDATLRHPADPYFPLMVAQLAWASRDGNPMPGLQRSFERALLNGRAHLLLAEILMAQKRTSQGRLELRLAIGDDPDLMPTVVQLALVASANLEQLLETVPAGSEGIPLLARLADAALPERRLSLFQELLKRDPANSAPYRQLAAYYLDEFRKGPQSDACAGEKRKVCQGEFDSDVLALERLRPTFSDADVYRAQLLMVNGEPERAEELLASRCAKVDDRWPCQFARARAALGIKSPERLHRVVHDLAELPCSIARECADQSVGIGDLLAARGEWGTALTFYIRACRQEASEARWLKLAGAAANVGEHAQAADALEQVARLRGRDDPQLRSLIEGERSRVGGRLFR